MNYLNVLFKLSHLNTNFVLTLGYLHQLRTTRARQTADNVLAVIINFIYSEFHM